MYRSILVKYGVLAYNVRAVPQCLYFQNFYIIITYYDDGTFMEYLIDASYLRRYMPMLTIHNTCVLASDRAHDGRAGGVQPALTHIRIWIGENGRKRICSQYNAISSP